MNHSSTSNSSPENSWPKLTPAGGTAIAVFLFFTILVHTMADRIFVEGDSIVIRNMKLTETAYLDNESQSPKILVMGSSRLVGTDVEMLASQTGLPVEKVQNLSTSGTTFFYVYAFLRQHPDIVDELELLVVDILPYQIMHTTNFQESSPYFLRYATGSQRWNVRKLSDRLMALFDFAIPMWSRSQPPFAWISGFQRSKMDIPALEEDLLRRPRQDFPNWQNLVRLMSKARRQKDGARKLNATIFFGSTDVARNQVRALEDILDLVPKDCRVALVWLPLSESTLAIVENSQKMRKSQEILTEIIDELTNPKLQVQWYSKPEQVGIDESDYTADGIHFNPKGGRKITQTIGQLYRESE